MSLVSVVHNAMVAVERLYELTRKVDTLEEAPKAFVSRVERRLEEFEDSFAHIRERVSRLEESRETIKAEDRAEVSQAIADLRVRYAEEQAAAKKQLPRPRKSR